jgi:anti-sigma B factor antagonist
MTRLMIITDPRQIGRYATGAASVIEAPADFDIYSAPAVRELAVQLQGGGATAIVFDMSGVTFMDNTALGVIVGTHKRLRSAGGEGAAVAAASEGVARCFAVTGLTKHLPMYATAAEALAAAQG